MIHQVTDPEIDSFYSWLKENLANIFDNKVLQQALTQRVESIHPELKWEVGPGYKKRRFFAFSPNLKHELLALTSKLVEKAPEIEGWEFLPAKPKKRWSKRNIKIRTQGQITNINFDNWKYFLTSFNDGEFFDVNLIPDGECSLGSEELSYAADLFVEFELGEELYIEAIDQVNLISPSKLESETDNVEHLNEHVLTEWKKVH